MRLFLYGSLLDPRLLARFAGQELPCVPATLRGWRRVALPRSRYPTLRRARGDVAGALVTVNAATMSRLSAYEGPTYRLTPVAVRTSRGGVAASTWIAPGGTRRLNFGVKGPTGPLRGAGAAPLPLPYSLSPSSTRSARGPLSCPLAEGSRSTSSITAMPAASP